MEQVIIIDNVLDFRFHVVKAMTSSVHFTVIGNNNIVGSVWGPLCGMNMHAIRVGVRSSDFFSPLSYDTGS